MSASIVNQFKNEPGTRNVESFITRLAQWSKVRPVERIPEYVRIVFGWYHYPLDPTQGTDTFRAQTQRLSVTNIFVIPHVSQGVKAIQKIYDPLENC